MADVMCEWTVSYNDFISALRFSQTLEHNVLNNTVHYNLEHYNCASATIDAAASCGIILPRNERVFYPTSRTGVCPGQLGQDIRRILRERDGN